MTDTETTRGELGPAIVALLAAATRFFDAAQHQYAQLRPEDHAAYLTLVEHGAQPYIEMRLLPTPSIETGFFYKGERHAIHEWPRPPERADLH